MRIRNDKFYGVLFTEYCCTTPLEYGTFFYSNITVPLPLALLLQNKLEYYVTLMHTQCTFFYVVLIVVLHPFLMLFYKTNTTQIGYSFNEYPYNASLKRKVFYETNELNYLTIKGDNLRRI